METTAPPAFRTGMATAAGVLVEIYTSAGMSSITIAAPSHTRVLGSTL
jgi:hypothetical protein